MLCYRSWLNYFTHRSDFIVQDITGTLSKNRYSPERRSLARLFKP